MAGIIEVKDQGKVRIYDADNSNYVDIVVPSTVSSNRTITIPDASFTVPQADTVYTHPNHSGEVTSTADGATVIADNIVDEANLKVSNSPTNGYMLTAQSGNTGGLTWAAAPTGFDPDGAVVFNESSADVDFRVESNGNDSMIKVDAGNDRVGIGRSSPLSTLDVNGNLMVDATGNSYGNKFIVGAPHPNSTSSGSGYGFGIGHTGSQYWQMYDANSYWNNTNSSNSHYVNFRTKANAVGSIHIQQSSTAFNTSSDYRLKENVDYNWDATSRLKQLKPARFNFIIDDTNTLVDGFIAHEVSSIVPEAISGEKDALEEDGSIKAQSIDQSKLVPLLVKTIQELEARITTLENA